MNIVIVGSSFGDEAKARIAHEFSKSYEWVIRSSGGNNCGHTIYSGGKKYVYNLVPSIDFNHKHVKGFLGSGMVIDLEHLYKELSALEEDFPGCSKQIYVDPDAFACLPKHVEGDKDNVKRIGSTGKGVGVVYVDKMSRTGTKVIDLIDQKHPSVDKLVNLGVNFKYVLELRKDFENSNCMFDGAQGVMLDINHGTYPYVTCADTTLASIYASGFAFLKIDRVYGVAKAYSTRVGEGPYPTEIFGPEAESLRARGSEFGAVTGRPRRVGWLDLPALKYACLKGGITDLIITKFDILDGMDTVPVATSYDKEPMSGRDFFTANANYTEVPGWEDSREVSQLAPFLKTVEDHVGLKVRYVSCGVNKEDLIKL